ncbi:MAG: family 16 glycoside hydrolase [Planctomycetota bacterium]|jgi:hypothetical protein
MPKSIFSIACVLATLVASQALAAKDTPLIGQTGMAGWRQPVGTWQNVGDAEMSAENPRALVALEPTGHGVIVAGHRGRTSNLISVDEHADCRLHVEFMVPEKSNSGVYLMGRYEVQVFSSYGKEKPTFSDAGGIYQRWNAKAPRGQQGYEGHAPRVNASKPDGEWQSFDIVFRAPRFDAAGNKTANAAFVSVKHNGVLVHENVELTGPTRASTYQDEKPTGPLMLQGDHGPVAYRNIRIEPLGAAPSAPAGQGPAYAGRTVDQWAARLDDSTRQIRLNAANTLANIGYVARERLAGMLDHKDSAVRYWGARGLGDMRPRVNDYNDALARSLGDKAFAVRMAAAYALRDTPHHKKAVDVLIDGLKTEERGYGPVAADYLWKMGPSAKKAVPALKKLAQNSDYHIKNAANRALSTVAPE